jgi:hypothetical protein
MPNFLGASPSGLALFVFGGVGVRGFEVLGEGGLRGTNRRAARTAARVDVNHHLACCIGDNRCCPYYDNGAIDHDRCIDNDDCGTIDDRRPC